MGLRNSYHSRLRPDSGGVWRTNRVGGMLLVMLTLLLGCPRRVAYVVERPRATTRPAVARRGWERVLKTHVKNGAVHYFGLAEDATPLEWYLSWLANHGPDSTPDEFPTPPARLAYWLNAHNASAVRAGLAYHRAQQKLPYRQRAEARPARPFGRITFRIDAKDMTLAEMARRARRLRPQDVRIEAALFDGWQSGPPLAGEAFLPDKIDRQLESQWQAVLSDRELTRIDHTKRTLFLPAGIYERRLQLLNRYEKKFDTGAANLHTALLWLADAKGRAWLNRAVGYSIRPLPIRRVLRQYADPWDDDP